MATAVYLQGRRGVAPESGAQAQGLLTPQRHPTLGGWKIGPPPVYPKSTLSVPDLARKLVTLIKCLMTDGLPFNPRLCLPLQSPCLDFRYLEGSWPGSLHLLKLHLLHLCWAHGG